ncbi:putative transcription factor [Thermochaetoides thermophila DSM 1495]|uniref:Mitochondrial division protein 1 n=1 Tax=Chaetomium thermophilum (strain DSM 1495 / CBS 144.50 / IMI 039719) TaxID=759272 RepID=G0RZS6_CHATD|nr:putative transcription factor [Thermochaetoides thermophila DSM 1495]EGS23704.1 putative transcription factor [Thermochaetoides thermophila DSM 1495]
MDDDYGSSENEQDELEFGDDMEVDNEVEDENEDEEEDQDEQDEQEAEVEAEPDVDAEAEDDAQPTAPDGGATQDATTRVSASQAPPKTAGQWRPILRQEYIDAPLYDIVPTIAAPQATSINAMAITPDLRYWMTGGSDGYIRKYDGMATINGKQLLTVAQRHPFVDSVVKAGVLMSYWENEEPAPPNARPEDRILSPVYSLAIHSRALWLLSGLESGGINLMSVRHDEGKRIHCLKDGHTNAVSVLKLAPDEKSVLSGGWDKVVLDWDLNNGNVIRRYEGSAGQISAIEWRPLSGAPIPAEAGEPATKSDTFFGDTRPRITGLFGQDNSFGGNTANGTSGAGGETGGSDDHDSIFGSPAGSLFGDNDTMGGGGGFGDEDDDFTRAMDMAIREGSNNNTLDHSGDFTMTDVNGPSTTQLESSTVQDGQSAQQKGTGTNRGESHVSNSDTMSSQTVQGQSDSQALTVTDSQSQQQASSSVTDDRQQTQTTSTNDAAQTQQQPQQSSADQQSQTQPSLIVEAPQPPPHNDPTQCSSTTFLSAAIDGTIRIWDRRMPNPVARINNRRGVPPWCMGACWSIDGNFIYAGRRNGTVEEYSIHKATSSWEPTRALKFPNGSGPVSCVRPMVNGRHLVCASYDILRLYDLRENAAFKHSKVPFIIIPGPPKAGVISDLYIDPTSRIMISIAGTRGWTGTSTEVMIGYEIHVTK